VLAITAAYPKNTTKKSAGKIRKKPTTNSSNAPNECCKFATTRGIQQEFATSVAKKDSTQKSQIAMRNRARFKKIRTLAAAATAELLPLRHLRSSRRQDSANILDALRSSTWLPSIRHPRPESRFPSLSLVGCVVYDVRRSFG
jgi:hypothetical protein